MYDRIRCPICQNMLVTPAGVANSDILLVGEYPGVEEMKQGVPFVGHTGEVLTAELSRVGISMRQCRLTNLWMHMNTKECSLDFHMEELAKEIKGRKYILLMGSETTKALFHKGVMELSGLVMKHPLYTGTAVVAPNPASAFKKGATVGELRHAIQIFKGVIDAAA